MFANLSINKLKLSQNILKAETKIKLAERKEQIFPTKLKIRQKDQSNHLGKKTAKDQLKGDKNKNRRKKLKGA